jgi:hypothetical protein
MSAHPNAALSPFGEADCESEVKVLGDEYRVMYFKHTEFNARALDHGVYLIVGRRGSGKTALAHSFSFQKQLRTACAIDIDEPFVYQEVLSRLSTMTSETRELAIPRLAKLWEFVIWGVIFRELREKDKRIADACLFDDNGSKGAKFIQNMLRTILAWFSKTDDRLADDLEDFIAEPVFAEARRAVLERAKAHQVVVSFDTLENYNVRNEPMVRATAALIECASRFNRDYASQGVHLKVFVMAEVFPFLMEEAIPNTTKHVRNEIYLHWRPKDLMRLLCWRYYRYLKATGESFLSGPVTDWDDHRVVKEHMWTPYFGDDLTNGQQLLEKTFPYVLRHTQLRPRQLILLCNAIALKAKSRNTFPRFDMDSIRDGIRTEEAKLATEVINSYNTVYPNVGQIVGALNGIPSRFPASELDRRAPMSASEWPNSEYSPLAFSQLVAELGIVGRVRKADRAAGYIDADFEYATDDRLRLTTDDDCVVHPMFYKKLNVRMVDKARVYPFPDHTEFAGL